jgi:glyoxylate/hydroxypyruvate reductase A
MNGILLAPDFDLPDDWIHRVELGSGLGVHIVLEHQIPDDDIQIAIIDGAQPGRLARLRNLQVVFSLSAGIDSLIGDPFFPNVPIVRIIPAAMVSLMREYVCYHALRTHRGFAAIEVLQNERRWEWLAGTTPATERTVVVLGLGSLGAPTAQALSCLGFKTFGWSRHPRTIDGVTCLHGVERLLGALPRADILVSLLPSTPSTANLISSDVFSRMPHGASLISTGRGQCINDGDLLDALDSDHLRSATLDVFAVEPLPKGHPFWSHPKVTVTPHMAAYPKPTSFVEPLAQQLKRFVEGELRLTTACRERGY